MLICLACALTGHVVRLRTITTTDWDIEWLETHCSRCRADGHFPPLVAP